MAQPKVVYRFKGDEESGRIPGVPMRDLTEEDVAVIPPAAMREALYATIDGKPMFAPVGDAPGAPPLPTTTTSTTTTTPAPGA